MSLLFIPISEEDQLKEHTIMCWQHQSQQIRYPTPGKDVILKFTKIHYQFPVPFVIYADFECFWRRMTKIIQLRMCQAVSVL